MTNFLIGSAAVISILLSSPALAQEESSVPQLEPAILTADFGGSPFPGGLRFSTDGSTLWTDRLDAWSVSDGRQVDSSPFGQLTDSRQIIDFVANDQSMMVANEQTLLIANPRSGELFVWDQDDGLRSRVLKQAGNLVAARYLDQGDRFAVVFAEPPSIYYGDVDSDENDSIIRLATEVFKCEISPDGNLIAIRKERDIEIWDVQEGGILTALEHDHQPFSFTFSHDGRWIATGTSNDNRVRLFDTTRGELVYELDAHTPGTIFLTSAVYSLAFALNGKWLASGGHDGRVVVWDLENGEPLWQTQIEGPPIVCSLVFSSDSRLLGASFENAGAKRGVRVWSVSGETE